MFVYQTNPETGELLSIQIAQLDPLETELRGENVYLIPAHATTIEPPEAIPGHVRVFNSGAWEHVPDYRGMTVWDTGTGARTVIANLGPLPPGVTVMAPPPYAIWTGDGWEVDVAAQDLTAKHAEIEAKITAELRQIAIASLIAKAAL